ncbi:hypothetical protein [Streptomyces zaomyceticus]|uniref:Uncharacterized protein n=1 Tax=Streptomyces zaomyceticus TaxID=68286 RepID=A0ABZ1LMW6_9ACTN|nr:hypothetical protein OG237_42095 [Streptomyces zaomyceticus]
MTLLIKILPVSLQPSSTSGALPLAKSLSFTPRLIIPDKRSWISTQPDDLALFAIDAAGPTLHPCHQHFCGLRTVSNGFRVWMGRLLGWLYDQATPDRLPREKALKSLHQGSLDNPLPPSQASTLGPFYY